MNIAKNMEALFFAAAVLACSAAYADTAAAHRAAALAAASSDMPSLTITAKRLSAAERAEMVRQ